MASNQASSPLYEDVILRREFESWIACREPEAWAQYREPACKTLPWFRDLQGGVCMTTLNAEHPEYSQTPYITGILVDKYTPANSYIDAEVIITSIHGSKKGKASKARASGTAENLGEKNDGEDDGDHDGSGGEGDEEESREVEDLSEEVVANSSKEDIENLSSPDKRRINALPATRHDKTLIGCMVGSGLTRAHPISTKKTSIKTWSHPSGRAFFPCPRPNNQNYWVLGFYILTDFWKAYNDQGVTTMVRLERWKIEDKAWFANSDPTHNPPLVNNRDFTTRAPQEICVTCREASPRMFEEFFLCRNKDCKDHWRHEGEIVRQELTYEKSFLQQREPRVPGGYKPYGAYKGDVNDFPAIAPSARDWWHREYEAFLNTNVTADDFISRMKSLQQGFWCPTCGMMNRRLKWSKWDCANANCSFELSGKPNLMTTDQLTTIGLTKPPEWLEMTPCPRVENNDEYMEYHFDLAPDCYITVMVPKVGTNGKERGSNWLLHEFQTLTRGGQIDLRRQFIKTPVIGSVTSHYSHNYGESYKVAVDISKQSTSFENAPEVLSDALKEINKLCHPYLLKHGEEDFNQCYVAGYFTGGGMKYHSDGEVGLGKVIATWTLGGEGKMLVAPNHDQYWATGKPKTKPTKEDLLLPGSHRLEERKVWKQTLDAVLAADSDPAQVAAARAVYEANLMTVVKKRGRDGKPKKPLLEIPLTHGSVVVMHGKNMQKYFVHEISVETPLRFALTFRRIMEENVLKGRKVQKNIGVYPHVPDEDFNKRFLEGSEAANDKGARAAGDKRRRSDGEDDGSSSQKPQRKRKDDDNDESSRQLRAPRSRTKVVK